VSPRARKRFGQHFLHERNVIDRIVAAIAPSHGDHIVEIGGGHGALTFPLAARVARLDVIEVDRDLAAELERALSARAHVTIHVADALDFELDQLAADAPLRVVGNLPYNISTPLLFRLLSFRPIIRDMHVMLQKEVVDRMTARPGTKAYGRLTVMLSRWTDIEACFDIGPGAFKPAPKVRSSLARIRTRQTPKFPVDDESKFARIVGELFSMRRKTLARSLRGRVAATVYDELGVDPRTRAETLDPATLARLAAAVD
jgi:16S rRNA (adenine1518-N6/adenine1519-N6)-dimethyltransferase